MIKKDRKKENQRVNPPGVRTNHMMFGGRFEGWRLPSSEYGVWRLEEIDDDNNIIRALEYEGRVSTNLLVIIDH